MGCQAWLLIASRDDQNHRTADLRQCLHHSWRDAGLHHNRDTMELMMHTVMHLPCVHSLHDYQEYSSPVPPCQVPYGEERIAICS